MITPHKYFSVVPKSINMEVRSELYSTNEFTFAVAVILSAQATDKKVNEVTPALFKIAPTPEKMVALGIDGIKKYISQISFFNNKAKSIYNLAQQLIGQDDTENWKFPKKYHNRDELNVKNVKFTASANDFADRHMCFAMHIVMAGLGRRKTHQKK